MSGHTKCTCGRKRGDKSTLRILHYKCNYSAFESPKWEKHPSDYSLVICIAKGCRGSWRTKNIKGY